MIVIVGSRELWPTPAITAKIVSAIMTLGPDETIGIRASMGGTPSSAIEEFVDRAGPMFGHNVHRHCPAANDRADVFKRDIYLTARAQRVLAFFSPEQEMQGGTGHVVKAAMDRSIPVEAYGLDPRGAVEMIGSDDGLDSRPGILLNLWEEAWP